MKMSLPDFFDANVAVTADTVNLLTITQLTERLAKLSAQAGSTQDLSRIVVRVPSLSGARKVDSHQLENLNELGIIARAVQRKLAEMDEIIDALKTGV